MAIIYQKDAGLQQGLQQGLGALAQAFGERLQAEKRNQQRKNISDVLSQGPINESTLAKILSQPGGQEFIKEMAPILGPILKEQARSQGALNWLEQMFPGKFNSPRAQGAAGGEFLQRIGLEPESVQVSPIDEARSRMSNVPDISGVPNGVSEVNSNRIGPREQEMYQQGGHQGMGLEPPQETVKAPLINQQGQFNLTDLSDEDLVKLASSPYKEHQNLSASEMQRRKLQGKDFREERRFQTDLGKKGHEKIEGLRESLPSKQNALSAARIAVESGKVGGFSKANLARILGRPELQTAEGAALITASKENLLSNMSRVSARAQNQWFEQRLNSMFPQIGQSREANLTVQEMLEGEVQAEKSLLKAYDDVSENDMLEYGYVKGDALKRAYKIAEPEQKRIFDRSVYRMKQLEEEQNGEKRLNSQVGKSVPHGTPLTLRMAAKYIDKFGSTEKALQAAKKNGYHIYSKDDIMFFNEPIQRGG